MLDPEKRKNYDTYGFNGPKANNYSHRDFNQANDIFANFFSNNGFDQEDDFFKGFFNRRSNRNSPFGGGLGFSSSMFDNDDFFKGAFSSSSSTFSSGGSGLSGNIGFSKSTSTTTKTVYSLNDLETVKPSLQKSPLYRIKTALKKWPNK